MWSGTGLSAERGEELVYCMEIERVRSMGYQVPEHHVVWTSRTDPSADQDIKSISEAFHGIRFNPSPWWRSRPIGT
jgi:hypothetical protein